MAANPWFSMAPEERKRRAARYQGGGLEDGGRIIKRASDKKEKGKS